MLDALMPIDVDRARRETPGCARVVHLNNAGAALPPAPVLDAVIAHLRLEAETGGYEAADVARDRLEATYHAVARLLGCDPAEVALVESATRAWDMAFYALHLKAGDRILTSAAEYASNFIPFLQRARLTGAVIEVVPSEADGRISVEALEASLRRGGAALVALTHVPTNGGLVNPAAEVGRLARAAGVPFILDACQSAGQMPLDVSKIGCDVLSATGRKFLRGPRGTGLLYVRRSLLEHLEPPLLDLHAASWVAPDRYELRGDARRFESWESSIAGRIGLGVAALYALGWGMEAIRDRVFSLAARTRTRLATLPGVATHDLGADPCGIVSVTCEGVALPAVRRALRARGVNVSVSGAAATLLDMQARGLDAILRVSPHYYNTEDEIDALVSALGEVLAELRS